MKLCKRLLLSKRSILFITIFGGYFWLTFLTLHPSLPTPSNPILFYSNHIHSDLKLTLLSAIKKAKHSIFLQMYGLTDSDIIALLGNKIVEGIQTHIFYDKRASVTLPSHLAAVPIKSSGLMHKKILILDNTSVFLGTANYTKPSLKMHDNLVIGIYNKELSYFLQTSSENSLHSTLGNNSSFSLFLLPESGKKALQEICKCLDKAKESIHIAMFTFTHPLLIQKLLTAKKRGVNVTVAIDRYTASGASKKHIQTLKEGGIAIWTSQGNQLFHHKWALLDGKTFLLGSANWTQAAFEKNQDFLLIIDGLPSKHTKTLNQIWRAIANTSRKE